MMRTMLRAVVVVVVTMGLAACGDDSPTASAGNPDEAPVTGSQGDATGPGRSDQGVVEGVVRGADGSTVAGALVVPVPLDDPAPAIPELAVVTDDAGAYTWNLPDGRYELRATKDGTAMGSARVEVAAGEAVVGDIGGP